MHLRTNPNRAKQTSDADSVFALHLNWSKNGEVDALLIPGRRESTASHEAGHGIIAYRHQLEVCEIRIGPEPGSGHVQPAGNWPLYDYYYERPDSLLNVFAEDCVRRMSDILVAGSVAEAAASGYSMDDCNLLCRVLRYVYRTDIHVGDPRFMAIANAARVRVLNAMRGMATARAHTTLARILSRRDSIDGAELEALCRAYNVPLAKNPRIPNRRPPKPDPSKMEALRVAETFASILRATEDRITHASIDRPVRATVGDANHVEDQIREAEIASKTRGTYFPYALADEAANAVKRLVAMAQTPDGTMPRSP